MMELPKIPTVYPREIFAKKDAHLSLLLENTYSVYAPLYEMCETLTKWIKKEPKGSKTALGYIQDLHYISSEIEKDQLKWGDELIAVLKEKAKTLNLSWSDELDNVLFDFFVDGRYMENVYNSMTVQAYADAVLRDYLKDDTILTTENLIALNYL